MADLDCSCGALLNKTRELFEAGKGSYSAEGLKRISDYLEKADFGLCVCRDFPRLESIEKILKRCKGPGDDLEGIYSALGKELMDSKDRI